MDEYIRIAHKKERLILGLMSGTSLDGIDLALVRLSGTGFEMKIELVKFATEFMPDTWRKRIREAFNANTREICKINFDLGHFLSDRILHFCREANLPLKDLDAIGCHGQTLYHVNHHSTLQTGEADVIAARTQTLVISDFRTADIAAGGSGAPLVPYLDQLLFKNRTGPIALQNIGGIGNVTYLPEDPAQDIIAFDTGPGNAVLNELVEIITAGEHSFDCDAFLSKQGRCDDLLLSDLLSHPYFQLNPPKSTGREEFGAEYVKQLLFRRPGTTISQNDLLRTLVSLVTHSITNAYQKYFPPLDHIYLSGGGVHHPLILGELKELLGEQKVTVFQSENGISADAKEAVAFAVLAHERINNTPANIPSVTGARKRTTLGKISIPDFSSIP
ncbi:MAG: anhydro-N-acetylmuramic acid kinase [SAR324 cluster bacterium]|nr:anhydro-N-acetylmuramic acid kinase [SAR324 cluster bacterium]